MADVYVLVPIQGLPLQACGSSDYEQWRPLKPQDGSPAPCLLGRDFSMQRRKRDAACFNGLDWMNEGQVQKCPCGQVCNSRSGPFRSGLLACGAVCLVGQDWMNEGQVQKCPCGQVCSSRSGHFRSGLIGLWGCLLDRPGLDE